MTNQVQIINAKTAGFMGSRPQFNKRTGEARITNGRGMYFNSILKRDEWKDFDAAVVEAARNKLAAVQQLRSRGLEYRLGGIGTLVSYYYTASQMTAANVTMSGQANGDQDRVEFNLAGVPVPVIYKDFMIGARELEAIRMSGSQVDTTNARAASTVVAETFENMLFNGSGMVFNGQSIYGLTTQPNRSTATATSYGGGDWSTATNIVPTVVGMMSTLAGNGFRGPYGVYVARPQYFETMVNITSTDETPLQRLLALPGIEFVEYSDWLTSGNVVVVQLSSDVVDIAVAQDIVTVEWMAQDGSAANFKVMMVGVPRVKSEYAGKTGIAHATSA